MTETLAADHRYLVVSADCHAGAPIDVYRGYLPSKHHDTFDDWVVGFVNPFSDLQGADAERSWNSSRRVAELDVDGIAAEVLFPNTIPPFFPRSNLSAPPPSAEEYELRWAGLQAHNRWMVDFCAEAPERRAGVAQILLNDIDDAVAEVHWAADNGLGGGILLPGVPPGSGLPPLHAPDYDPIWAACEERDLPVNHHAGSAVPEEGLYDTTGAVFILEVAWFAHRALWQLIFSGAFERHPDLQFVLTEQGTGWVAQTLPALDFYLSRFRGPPTNNEAIFGSPAAAKLSLTPSEYWARNCHVGASFLGPGEAALRHEIGVDRIMWGSDYPHTEGTYPHSLEALRLTFASIDPGEVQAMVGTNAAALYGFDTEALAPIAARIGPTVGAVAEPLAERPAGATSPVFAEELVAVL